MASKAKAADGKTAAPRAAVAARSCRVSSSTTGKPAACSPAWSHWDRGPASRPTRAKTTPAPFRAATSASDSLSTLSSRTTAPAPSTMQMLLVSSETSIPA
jgi:hypothetical protein